MKYGGNMRTPTTIVIMDGYGIAPPSAANAISAAKTPVIDGLLAKCPNAVLKCSGEDVGLPKGQIGNSEVGHINIGAGRVVYQDLPKISASIDDGSFFDNPAYCKAVDCALEKGTALHIFALMSDGGVHSHNTHVWGLLELAKRRGLKNVYVHCFTDGRDVLPRSAEHYIKECVDKCAEIGVGKIATVIGRFYVMDRDKRWERLKKAYDALVGGVGEFSGDPVCAVKNEYERGITDEFIEPIICDRDGTVKPEDSIIFANFRPDRAREITRAFCDPEFNEFEHEYFPVQFVCTTQYDETMPNVSIAFPPETAEDTLGEIFGKSGLRQLRIAETEKYAHVTFFFNGGEEKVFNGEDRVLIPSPKSVPTYDLIPEMSAREVAEECCARIKSGMYDVIIVNFANCDMVGHTGVFDAAVKAVETVDECVGMVIDATAEIGGIAIITADHGNAEQMIADDGVTPNTAHTTNHVPCIVYGADVRLRTGRLADIAPTVLDLLGLEKPEKMSGCSLIV